jgi:hypothetical protein
MDNEAKQCKVCKQSHRDDYRVWSEIFQEFMTSLEFVAALNSKRPIADVKSHLHAFALPDNL